MAVVCVGLPEPVRGPEKVYFLTFSQDKGNEPLKFLIVKCSVIVFQGPCVKMGHTTFFRQS